MTGKYSYFCGIKPLKIITGIMTDKIVLQLSNRQRSTGACNRQVSNFLASFQEYQTISKLFMLITFYPYRYNLGQVKYLFLFDNAFMQLNISSKSHYFWHFSFYDVKESTHSDFSGKLQCLFESHRISLLFDLKRQRY